MKYRSCLNVSYQIRSSCKCSTPISLSIWYLQSHKKTTMDCRALLIHPADFQHYNKRALPGSSFINYLWYSSIHQKCAAVSGVSAPQTLSVWLIINHLYVSYPRGMNCVSYSAKRTMFAGHKKRPIKKWPAFHRDPSGARTQDPNIKSVVLYLLS